jgi:hypothetical protein
VPATHNCSWLPIPPQGFHNGLKFTDVQSGFVCLFSVNLEVALHFSKEVLALVLSS